MTTTLGARRKVGNAAPAPRAPDTCDVLAQDCERPELACHLAKNNYCDPDVAATGPTSCNTVCGDDMPTGGQCLPN